MENFIHNNAQRIFAIDSHPIFLEGIKNIVNRDKRFCLVGEAGNGREGLKLIRKLRPNLVTMEIWFQDQNWIQLIKEIKNISPEIRIIILTLYREIKYIIQAFKAGATGYLLKETDAETFIKGFETVLKGKHYVDNTISPDLVATIKESITGKGLNTYAVKGCLTAREEEVTRLVAEGFPRKEIANLLCISPKTVENHISKIMKKLCLRNTIELIRWAARLGLINLDEWSGESSFGRYQKAVA